MKVDSMRKIDKWAGVPLCFVCSLFIYIMNLFSFSKKIQPDTTRTLFIELSEMGSAILVDPAMRKLKKETNADISVGPRSPLLGCSYTTPGVGTHLEKSYGDTFREVLRTD